MSAAPTGVKRLGQYRGRIVRWGAGGFGFIQCAELRRDTYFKDDWVVGFVPAVGAEVEFEAVEYPGDKIVARTVRAAGEPGPPAAERAPLKARIRGLESLPPASRAVVPASGSPPIRPTPAPPRPALPTNLAGIVREAVESRRARVAALGKEASELEAKATAVTRTTAGVRAEAERRRGELERQIAELERDAERRVDQLVRDAELASARASELRREGAALAEGAEKTACERALEHMAAARRKLREDLAGRDLALAAARAARAAAAAAVGDEAVRKYEDARRQAHEADSADGRDAFTLLEQQRRQGVRPYAEALDRIASWAALVAPLWLLGSPPPGGPVAEPPSAGRSGSGAGDAGAVLVAPFDAADWEADGSVWRAAAALVEAVERGREDLAGAGGAGAMVEWGQVAGLVAARVAGLETDLLPLLLEDALAARPTLGALGLGFGLEDARDVRLPMDAGDEELDSLDSEPPAAAEAPAGGATREVAKRLGMTLAELVAALVARGLPFPDDSVAAGTEDSLRALLGVAPVPEREPGAPPAAVSPGAPAVPAALDIAARALGKLLRARVIGGKHTRIENVYGHHFSDAEKEPARAVTEQLLRLGILLEKTNLGARHVSINPRRLEDARRLAEGRSADREIIAALVEA